MSTVVQERINELVSTKKFRNEKLTGAVFDGMNLRQFDFRGASLVGGSFKGCDLTYTNFEGANLYSADFTDAKCYRTNFVEANLANSRMFAKDMMGVRISLDCKTFQGMKLKPGWWYGWLFYAHLMEAPDQEAEDKLIQALGPERFQVLKSQYATRHM